MPEDVTIRHVTIRGRVQGVGYRAWVAHTAPRHRLAGWVRNTQDGSVEAVFCGSQDAVAQMISDCRQGPSLARVDSVDEEIASADFLQLRPQGQQFAILPTL